MNADLAQLKKHFSLCFTHFTITVSSFHESKNLSNYNGGKYRKNPDGCG